MKKKIVYSSLAVLVILVGFFVFNLVGKDKQENQYQFGQVTRGDLETTISSTGVLSAVGTVEVGTQVSGTISNLYVDFNDEVHKDQLLAVLDTLLLKSAVLDAEANLEQSLAQLEKAKSDFKRNKPLYEKGYISEAEFLPYEISLRTQQAGIKSAEASLQRAERNLKYAVIRSPIAGTVIQRNVEAGQTVAASLQSPTLFVIAEDLSKMEIHAQVDESDIGQIKQGQEARFTVQSYPSRVFTGAVRQVRLQPETIQNVVLYTVVVDALNDEDLLLPGMTATVDFVVEKREDVLLAPNSALRFQPTEEMMAEFRKRMEKRFQDRPDSLQQQGDAFRGRFRGNDRMGQSGGNVGSQNVARIWHLGENGKPAMTRLRFGVTNGSITEIVAGRDIVEGMQIITGLLNPSNEPTRNSSVNERPRGFGRRGF